MAKQTKTPKIVVVYGTKSPKITTDAYRVLDNVYMPLIKSIEVVVGNTKVPKGIYTIGELDELTRPY